MGSGTLQGQFNPQFTQEEVNEFSRAAGAGEETTVENFLKKYPKIINAKDEIGRTALVRASTNLHATMVDLLLAADADVNSKDQFGRSVLMHTVQYGMEATAEVLLKKGAVVDEKDCQGQTPLMLAAQRRGMKMVDLLLKAGADANEKDSEGRSVVEGAQDKGDPEVAAYLEKYIKDREMEEELADFSVALKRDLPYKGPLKLPRKGM
jgi:ankyrin repeat protein